MTVVNFSITTQLSNKINKAIEEKGFSSKAEFFRFAVMQYLENSNESKRDKTEESFEETMEELAHLLSKKYKNKELPSVEEQFNSLLQ